MHLSLSAKGTKSNVMLWTVYVDDSGSWSFESRSVEQARGSLTEGDRAQLISLYEKVDWDHEVLNNRVTIDDDIIFHLDVTHQDGTHKTYIFTEEVNHKVEFRDLFHFLRHNIVGGGDPVGRIPNEVHDQPPAVQ